MNPEATLRYWMTSISVNVQINTANAILNSAININSSRLNKLYRNKDSCPFLKILELDENVRNIPNIFVENFGYNNVTPGRS